MRLSHIQIHKTTLIIINGKKNTAELQQELAAKNSPSANQLSIYNSHFDWTAMREFPHHIETLIIKKSSIINQLEGRLVGSSLKVIELPQCGLSVVPKISSSVLTKLNLSHNQIAKLDYIPSSSTLQWLDMRDNRLTAIHKLVFMRSNITFCHEFFQTNGNPYEFSALETDQHDLISVESLLLQEIRFWKSQKWIKTCEDLIDCDNEVLMHQLIPYLDAEFLGIIFQLAKERNQHRILQLLVTLGKIKDLSLEDKIMLLIPSLLPFSVLRIVPLELLVKSISISSRHSRRVSDFLSYLKAECEGLNIFIQSQKDLINFMSFSLKYRHEYQAQFIMTQLAFFQEYDFSNRAILRYLLSLQSLPLTKALLQHNSFKHQLFSSTKDVLKPNKKLAKIIHKAMKQYIKEEASKNTTWYFPEYRERKTFCLRNDVYDYEILKEYEEMQCSYLQKDFKYTIKFYNKGNQLSVAKKVESELKKSTMRAFHHKSRLTSISTSSIA